MAVKTITPVDGKLNTITEFTFTAATTAADGINFKLPVGDERCKILVTNTDASNAYKITLKKPTKGGYAAATSDVEHELAAGEFAVINVETARYANTDGTILLVPANVAVTAAVVY